VDTVGLGDIKANPRPLIQVIERECAVPD
jgi:hypothetical protein